MHGTGNRTIISFFLFLFLVQCVVPRGRAERVLVWEDNFDGSSLDTTAWTLETGNGCNQGDGLCGWGNHEQQTYTVDNLDVADGVLSITARQEEEEVDERLYTSSRVRSKPPVSFLTGRVEARIKLPSGLGLWAAFWMLPSNSTRGVWAATGEIDIMEAINDMDSIVGTIHYGGEYPANRYAGCKQSSGMDFSLDYHIFALEWEAEEMRWYVDDQLYCLRTKWTSAVDSFEPYRAPFDTEFELILNLAVGGTLPGRFVDGSVLPATMAVDYIRVYDIAADAVEAEPFFGVPVCLPGMIQAEAFDIGGLGLGYGDTQPEGGLGTYRVDGDGLVGTASGRTFLANFTSGDWAAYSIMTEGALYDISLEVWATEASAVELIIGDSATCNDIGTGQSLTNIFDIIESAEGEGQGWGTIVLSSVFLPEGSHSLKLCCRGGVGFRLDRMSFTLADGADASSLTSEQCAKSDQGRPYMFGLPWAIPGIIEAEFYDYGGLGVGFYESTPGTNFGGSTLRLPDGVDVIEAESNPNNGQYVGNWDKGEWLAFTSRAAESGYWNVGASIAAGINGSTATFRILANASNCSTTSTSGFDGLGPDGVDLLDGPLSQSYTGSWEAFEIASREDVWVPQGTHRLLFCADSGFFNLNYLWFWTPVPTPFPTPAPSPAPTPFPTVPGDGGFSNKWIYVSIFVPIALIALSRLGWIIFRKKEEFRKRHKPAVLDDYGSSTTSNDHGKNAFETDKTPPTGKLVKSSSSSSRSRDSRTGSSSGSSGGHGGAARIAREMEMAQTTREIRADLLGVEPVSSVVGGGGVRAGAAASVTAATAAAAKDNISGSSSSGGGGSRGAGPAAGRGHQNRHRHCKTPSAGQNLRRPRPPMPQLPPPPPPLSQRDSHASRAAPPHVFVPTPGERLAVEPSASSLFPVVSPVESALGAFSMAGTGGTPRASTNNRGDSGPEKGATWPPSASRGKGNSPMLVKNGERRESWTEGDGEAEAGGSSVSGKSGPTSTVSPMQGPRLATPIKGGSAPPKGPQRDQFEDALVRALEDKWERAKELGQRTPMRRNSSDPREGASALDNPAVRRMSGISNNSHLSRSSSFSETSSLFKGKNPMLAAGKCWTCVCGFENTVGQESCLGCGRVAPSRPPNTPSTTMKRLPPHRLGSWISPPTNV